MAAEDVKENIMWWRIIDDGVEGPMVLTILLVSVLLFGDVVVSYSVDSKKKVDDGVIIFGLLT